MGPGALGGGRDAHLRGVQGPCPDLGEWWQGEAVEGPLGEPAALAAEEEG